MDLKENRNTNSILSKYFNPHLNEFIAEGSSRQFIGHLRTGGEKGFDEYNVNPFYRLSSDLVRFRNEFSHKYNIFETLDKKQIIKAMEPLIKIYEEGASYKMLNQKHRDYLNNNFIEEIKAFLTEMDGLFRTKKYFQEEISKINVNQNVISDLDFAKQYFGKTSSLGIAIGQEEVRELEKQKEKIEEFAKDPYVSTADNLSTEKYKVSFSATLNGNTGKYSFKLFEVEKNSIYEINQFNTNEDGKCETKLWKGKYRAVLTNPKLLDDSKKKEFIEIEITKNMKKELKFEGTPETKAVEYCEKPGCGNKHTDTCPYCRKYFCIDHIRPRTEKEYTNNQNQKSLKKSLYYSHYCENYTPQEEKKPLGIIDTVKEELKEFTDWLESLIK